MLLLWRALDEAARIRLVYVGKRNVEGATLYLELN